MTDHRWTPSEHEVTESLRALYAAPSDAGYWSALESRILAHVARGAQLEGWWSAFGEITRPALAAAAILVLVAGAAVVHTQRLDARNAYASVISAAPPSVETAARGSSVADGDATLDYMLSH